MLRFNPKPVTNTPVTNNQYTSNQQPPMAIAFKEQVSALRHLPEFFKLIWKTHPGMAIGNICLRLLQSVIPLATLYVAKEIIDEIIRLVEVKDAQFTYLWTLVAIEAALGIVSDLISRGINPW